MCHQYIITNCSSNLDWVTVTSSISYKMNRCSHLGAAIITTTGLTALFLSLLNWKPSRTNTFASCLLDCVLHGIRSPYFSSENTSLPHTNHTIPENLTNIDKFCSFIQYFLTNTPKIYCKYIISVKLCLKLYSLIMHMNLNNWASAR